MEESSLENPGLVLLKQLAQPMLVISLLRVICLHKLRTVRVTFIPENVVRAFLSWYSIYFSFKSISSLFCPIQTSSEAAFSTDGGQVCFIAGLHQSKHAPHIVYVPKTNHHHLLINIGFRGESDKAVFKVCKRFYTNTV